MSRFHRNAAASLLSAVLLASAIAISPTTSVADSGGIGVTPGGDPAGVGSPADAEGTFPVRARHTYGDGLGAGRGHQGQDLLAKCGKDIVAAEAGRVRVVDYDAGGAGNYVVVRGKGFDYVYMHMLSRPTASQGERVEAGDPIGLVGSTGASTACHLHFEMWSRPGWYRGGEVTDPTPYLKSWDRRG